MDPIEQVWEHVLPVEGVAISGAPVLVVLALALLAVAFRPTWRLLRLGVTLVHELGHAGVGVLAGRRFTGFVLRGDMSGHAVTVGPARGLGRAADHLGRLPGARPRRCGSRLARRARLGGAGAHRGARRARRRRAARSLPADRRRGARGARRRGCPVVVCRGWAPGAGRRRRRCRAPRRRVAPPRRGARLARTRSQRPRGARPAHPRAARPVDATFVLVCAASSWAAARTVLAASGVLGA